MVNHPRRSKQSAALTIDRALAAKVLEVVDAGLCSGDEPTCVSPALRKLKICLKDKAWSSNEARALGLRRLAIAQLGSAGKLDETAFLQHVAEMTIRKIVPRALRNAASVHPHAAHETAMEAAAVRCGGEGTKAAAADADAADARDRELAFFAEEVVQILIAMDAPGCAFLDLAPLAA